jgi:hypothetical protein
MRIVLIILLAIIGFFAWDGFFPRTLTGTNLQGGAQIATFAQVEYSFFPIDQKLKYIIVSVENPTDYIIRSVSIAAQIKVGSDVNINIPSTQCVPGSNGLRILARTSAEKQSCIVPLSAEQSALIPDKPLSFAPELKRVDHDALKFTWSYTRIEGHGQPIKLAADVIDWFTGLGAKIAAPFQRVNK